MGVTYGKTLAQSLGKPLIGVNHLEGHVRAVFLEAYRAGREPGSRGLFDRFRRPHGAVPGDGRGWAESPASANGFLL